MGAALSSSASDTSAAPAPLVDDPPAPKTDRYTGQKLEYAAVPLEAWHRGYFIAALPLSGSPMDKLFADGRDIIETVRPRNSPTTLTLNKDGTYKWHWDFYRGGMGHDFACSTEECGKFAAAEVKPGKFRISYSDSVWTYVEPMYPSVEKNGVGQAPNHLETDIVFLDSGVFKLEKGPCREDWTDKRTD